MWYNTRHKLEIETIEIIIDNDEVFNSLKESDEQAKSAFDELWEYWEEIKGYDLEVTIREFSKKYPNKIFTLNWEWEEQGDVWKQVFCNWKTKKVEAEMKLPDISLEDLE
jgi:hypothetical protein